MNVVKMFKLVTGEMVVTEIEETREDGSYLLSYPLQVVPIPQQPGQQPQIGFSKLMPFSDYSNPIALLPSSIVVDSDADKKISGAYTQQIAQLKAQESGIIIPQGNIPKSVLNDAAAQDFGELNT